MSKTDDHAIDLMNAIRERDAAIARQRGLEIMNKGLKAQILELRQRLQDAKKSAPTAVTLDTQKPPGDQPDV